MYRRLDPPLSTRTAWWGKDSNLRRREPADLQSAPVGHLGTPPIVSRRPSRLEHPGDSLRADGENRTRNLPITNQLLCQLSYVSSTAVFCETRRITRPKKGVKRATRQRLSRPRTSSPLRPARGRPSISTPRASSSPRIASARRSPAARAPRAWPRAAPRPTRPAARARARIVIAVGVLRRGMRSSTPLIGRERRARALQRRRGRRPRGRARRSRVG